MGKIIAALNMTVDGICDHRAGIPDEALHRHYTELLKESDAILYGSTTYRLMEFWRTLLENPSHEPTMNDFAQAIDRIPKIVFSSSLKNVDWESARVARRSLKDELLELKKQSSSKILIGSRSLIIQLLNLNLIDEFQLCIHPMIEGKGLLFFDGINDHITFNLLGSKPFKSGAIILYYQPIPR